ncbi:phosphonate metabolism protein/1,5-bisphosphokinase (PRPP-forming) PhnN [Aestuariispira insulae]|uniref:Ribose 1,5-bisphosphate phosphokinase PhnN n=1 Tax=Aestuariispira insulae TaxID=1461337 RepID=A0A3D9H604_9PROT|nr:phosphonate metabolism protein/1,5-bisphosphokinase (PRPP-forming) PhnN [Aestuariispira insulae]RED44869.1 ribose 1,5-bisphosphokinase [Aestuariispira insulae]
MSHDLGELILVVGPSGAGKDSLLAGAREIFADDPDVYFPRRIVTRPRDAGGEDHIAMDPDAFAEIRAAGGFILHWHAHGLDYGIPREVQSMRREGGTVLVNVSRSVITEAWRHLAPVTVIEVTAPKEVLAERLRQRNRESEADIRRRLARPVLALPERVRVVCIDNGGRLETALSQFAEVIRQKNRQAAMAAENG